MTTKKPQSNAKRQQRFAESQREKGLTRIVAWVRTEHKDRAAKYLARLKTKEKRR